MTIEGSGNNKGVEIPAYPTLPEPSIRIAKIRRIYDLQNPLFIRCDENVTIYNGSDRDIYSVERLFYDYKKDLRIQDFTHEDLEFHSDFFRFFNDVEPVPGEERNMQEKGATRIITIDFPYNRPLRKGEFRTISLTYTIDYDTLSRHASTFILSLDDAMEHQVVFNKNIRYDCEISYLIYNSANGWLNSPQEIIPDGKIEIAEDFSYIRIKEPVEDSFLVSSVSFRLRRSEQGWIGLGYYVGMGAILVNAVMIALLTGSSAGFVLPVVAVVNTYLIITRGWLFAKDMDYIVAEFPSLTGKSSKISYNDRYRIIIALLMIELFVSLMLYSFMFNQEHWTILDIARLAAFGQLG